jgi:hypothetical protein
VKGMECFWRMLPRVSEAGPAPTMPILSCEGMVTDGMPARGLRRSLYDSSMNLDWCAPLFQ